MAARSRLRTVIPSTLAVAMLAVVISAALAPNTGAVPAQSSCQYGNCAQPQTISPYVYAAIGVVVVLAALLATLFLMRRRRGGGAARFAEAPPPPPPPPPEGEVYSEGMEGLPPVQPEYMEPPVEAVAGAEVLPPAGPPPGAGEADIDSLMDELDKISGEILKKGPAKKEPPTGGGSSENP